MHFNTLYSLFAFLVHSHWIHKLEIIKCMVNMTIRVLFISGHRINDYSHELARFIGQRMNSARRENK